MEVLTCIPHLFAFSSGRNQPISFAAAGVEFPHPRDVLHPLMLLGQHRKGKHSHNRAVLR